MNCLICNEPLGPLELDRSNCQFHFDCQKCVLCNSSEANLQADRVNECLSNGYAVSHLTCWQAAIEKELALRPITITQETLDYLNQIRLMIEPNLGRSIEDNQSSADVQCRKYMHERSIDEQFIFLKRVQSICATASICYHNNKEQLNVKIRREESYEERLKRDRKLVEDSETIRENQEVQKRKKREVLSGEAKAIKSLMSLGMSEADARKNIDEGKVLHQMKQVANSKTVQ